MQTYRCTCGNRLFFDNTCCVACLSEVGWCEACSRIATLQPAEEGPDGIPEYDCGHADCRKRIRKCRNYSVENVCNRCFCHVPNGNPPLGPDGEAVVDEGLCVACEITETIPDLSIEGHREKWARLEAAKRKLLYMLDRLGLPYRSVEPKLSFDFKADVEHPNDEWRNAGPTEIVYTGHAEGKITINLREADDAVREHLRVQFHEAHRTLIGHFRHEVGHYFWQLLIQNKQERAFHNAFGDYDNPPYQEAMSAYYQNGPRPDWRAAFISAYAAAHPWEDFAETFALYLDMTSVLDTANHLFKSMRANFQSRSVAPLVERFQEVGILVNEFNRTMGLIDLVPEVIVAPVIDKLEFIHAMVKRAARQHGSPAVTKVKTIAS